MTDGVEIHGNASADETAAIMAAIALVLEEERRRAGTNAGRSTLSPWVKLGRVVSSGGTDPRQFPGR